MHFIFADDASQKRPTRKGMGPLVAIGGIIVAEDALQNLENEINELCKEAGFPPKAIFKWSPRPSLWMSKKLTEDKRENFFIKALNLANQHGAKALVVMEDKKARSATGVKKHEEDVVKLFLEHVHNYLSSIIAEGIVIIARPSGGRRDEDSFLSNCVDALEKGTDYVKYSCIALNILTANMNFVRLLQLADIVSSCSTAAIAGESRFTPPVFSVVKELLIKQTVPDRFGGIGLKIHPDFKYINLYHWLLGDTQYWKRNTGVSLPLKSYPYNSSPDTP